MRVKGLGGKLGKKQEGKKALAPLKTFSRRQRLPRTSYNICTPIVALHLPMIFLTRLLIIIQDKRMNTM